MREDIASNRFLWINSISHTTTRISHNLVSEENSDVELFRDHLELLESLAQVLLPRSQLAPAAVVDPEGSHDGVDDQEAEGVLAHLARRLDYHLVQVVHRVRSANQNVPQDLLWVQFESFRDRCDSFWPERVLRVDVQNLASTASHLHWKLSGD